MPANPKAPVLVDTLIYQALASPHQGNIEMFWQNPTERVDNSPLLDLDQIKLFEVTLGPVYTLVETLTSSDIATRVILPASADRTANVKDGQTLTYALVARDSGGFESSPLSATFTVNTPPSVPLSSVVVQGVPTGGQETLSWSPLPLVEPNHDGWNVYKASGPAFPLANDFSLVGGSPFPIGTLQHVFPRTADGVVTTYQVFANDSSGPENQAPFLADEHGYYLVDSGNRFLRG